mmetsp:Transcript_5669/g.8447  ORF Transcript_5669/g.8447 Transcript_5669/m.8447 type:complete len:961 (-) Transcript_5669:154-3036(-)
MKGKAKKKVLSTVGLRGRPTTGRKRSQGDQREERTPRERSRSATRQQSSDYRSRLSSSRSGGSGEDDSKSSSEQPMMTRQQSNSSYNRSKPRDLKEEHGMVRQRSNSRLQRRENSFPERENSSRRRSPLKLRGRSSVATEDEMLEERELSPRNVTQRDRSHQGRSTSMTRSSSQTRSMSRRALSPSNDDKDIKTTLSSGSESTNVLNPRSPRLTDADDLLEDGEASPLKEQKDKGDGVELEGGSVYDRTLQAMDQLKTSIFAGCMTPQTGDTKDNDISSAKLYNCGVTDLPDRFNTRRDLSKQLTESAEPSESQPVTNEKSAFDSKRGVRWDDEEDTALQARRAKRILSSKRLRPYGENKIVDEEFLNMISTCDARELSAIIKSICTDSNDKFVTMSLSQRFPTARDKILEKLTSSRLDDLDVDSKFALILVLANQNENGEVGRYMARLWFSIDQKERVMCENELGLQVAASARRCCCEDLHAFPGSLWEVEGKIDLSGLASDDPHDLPNEVREAGEYAIDTLAKGVLAFFPQNGHGITLIGSPILDLLMDELGIGSLKTEIDWRSAQARFNDIAEFVHEITDNVKRNPILLASGAAWTQLDEFFKQACLPERTIDMEADVRYAVGYCFLHYVLCEAIIMGPRSCDMGDKGTKSFLDLMIHLLDVKKEEENQEREKWIMNSFEHNQIAWLDTYMRSYAQVTKSGGSKADDKLKNGIYLPSQFTHTMLDEMCENVRKGGDNNASAGFDLLLEPPGSRECDSILNSGPVEEWVYNSGGEEVRSGVLLYKSPFPIAWNNLYEAWSLASSSNYADSVDFIGMILQPVLSRVDPTRKDGLYLSTRLISTFIHMNCALCARTDAKNFCTTATDFRSDVMTQLFGLVNKEAGKQYKKRVDKANESKVSAASRVQNEAKRLAMQSIWGTMRSAIYGAKGVKKIPNEVLSTLKGMNDMIEEWGQDVGIV